MSITRQETAYLPAPPYSGSAIGVEWLKGTITKERYSEILHNSHPDGGVTELDVLVQDVVPGLGPFNIRLLSDCVSNPSPSPIPTNFKTDEVSVDNRRVPPRDIDISRS